MYRAEATELSCKAKAGGSRLGWLLLLSPCRARAKSPLLSDASLRKCSRGFVVTGPDLHALVMIGTVY
jgi:hypothetical protein